MSALGGASPHISGRAGSTRYQRSPQRRVAVFPLESLGIPLDSLGIPWNPNSQRVELQGRPHKGPAQNESKKERNVKLVKFVK